MTSLLIPSTSAAVLISATLLFFAVSGRAKSLDLILYQSALEKLGSPSRLNQSSVGIHETRRRWFGGWAEKCGLTPSQCKIIHVAGTNGEFRVSGRVSNQLKILHQLKEGGVAHRLLL